MNRGGGWRGANVHARMQGSPRPSTRCARIPPAPLRKRSGVQVAYAKSESGAAGSRDGSWRALLSHHLRHLQLECLIKNSELLAHRMILFGWMIHPSRCPRKVAHNVFHGLTDTLPQLAGFIRQGSVILTPKQLIQGLKSKQARTWLR